LPLVTTTPAANLPPVSMTPTANFATSSPCVVDTSVNDTGGKLPLVSTTPVANNGNNIRLQTPESELEGKNLYICFLNYPKVTKQKY
jgi:hypothetical protein